MSSVYEHTIRDLYNEPLDFASYAGKVTLIVNVASKCGLTPQYTGLVELQEQFKDKGFAVLGVPCNQFGGQEPGTVEEIALFCAVNYGVTFRITEKVEVNGDGRHPLYQTLTAAPDAEGEAGDIQWNFEKFLISRDGQIIGRYRPGVKPEELTSIIEAAL